MNVIRSLTSNYIINVGVVAWMLAQIGKTILTLVSKKKLVLERLVGSGGMPSSHSSTTVAVAIAMAKKLGFESPLFGLSLIFALIVMYDAMGVRRAAGEQAKVLNRIVFEFPIPFFQKLLGEKQDVEEEKTDVEGPARSIEQEAEEAVEAAPILEKQLKEYLGHTPLEVLGGCLVGILVAGLMPAF